MKSFWLGALPIVLLILVAGCRPNGDDESIPTLLTEAAHKKVVAADPKGMALYKISMADKDAISQCVEELNSKDVDVRELATGLVGDIRLTEYSGNVTKLLNDSSPKVQLAAVNALGKIEDPKSLPDLIKVSEDTRTNSTAPEELRAATITALANFSDPTAKAEIEKHLTDADGKSRALAWHALAELGAKEHLNDAIKAFQTEKDVDAKAGAASAILLLDPNNSAKEQIHAFIKPLLTKDGNKMDRDVRGFVVQAAGIIRDKSDAIPIARLMRRHGIMAYYSFPALAAMGTKEAYNALVGRFEDRETDVVWYCGVARWDGFNSVTRSELKNTKSPPDYASACIFQILRTSKDQADRANALKAAENLSDDKNWIGRYRLAIGLRNVDDPSVKPVLDKLSNDSYEAVQRAAKGEIIDRVLIP